MCLCKSGCVCVGVRARARQTSRNRRSAVLSNSLSYKHSEAEKRVVCDDVGLSQDVKEIPR